MEAEMKVCSRCGNAKSLEEFYRHKSGRQQGRLYEKCKDCNREQSREWRQQNPDKQREQGRLKYQRQRIEAPRHQAARAADWRARNPERARLLRNAHHAVLRAVRSGRIERPNCCESCGTAGVVEGHHPDHRNRLEVEWLCRLCHRKADRENASV